MNKLLTMLLILLIPGVVMADLPFTPRLTVIPKTEYVNGDPLPSSEIVEHIIYCAPGTTIPLKSDPSKYVLDMPQLEITTANADWTPFGPWTCGSTTVVTNGQESDIGPMAVFPVAPNRPSAPDLTVQ